MSRRTSEVAIIFFPSYLARGSGSGMIRTAWETQKTGIAVYVLDLASIVSIVQGLIIRSCGACQAYYNGYILSPVLFQNPLAEGPQLGTADVGGIIMTLLNHACTKEVSLNRTRDHGDGFHVELAQDMLHSYGFCRQGIAGSVINFSTNKPASVLLQAREMGNALRQQPMPSRFGTLQTAVTEDVLQVGLLFAFGIIAASFIVIIPGIRGWEVRPFVTAYQSNCASTM